jgi:hypothetical protein
MLLEMPLKALIALLPVIALVIVLDHLLDDESHHHH